MIDKLTEPNFETLYICKKYGSKKFFKASGYAMEWARSQIPTEGEGMVFA